MTTELQTYTAQLPTVPDVRPDQVEWIAKVRQSPVLRMDEDQATAAVVAALVQIAPYLTEPPENHVSREFAKVFKEAYFTANFNPATFYSQFNTIVAKLKNQPMTTAQKWEQFLRENTTG